MSNWSDRQEAVEANQVLLASAELSARAFPDRAEIALSLAESQQSSATPIPRAAAHVERQIEALNRLEAKLATQREAALRRCEFASADAYAHSLRAVDR